MQKVIIIGATSGIGRELAKLYIAAGHKAAVTGRRQELLDSLQHEFPTQIITACFDVMGNENIAQVQHLINTLGGLDLLIYNSGYGEPSEEVDWPIDQQTIAINVNGFTEIINFAFNFFAKQGHGQIAATSSIASNRGSSYAPAYSASKAFISNYMEGLAIKSQKKKLNIIITDIQPGFVRTKMAKGNGQFWVIPVNKAVAQMFSAIQLKKRRVYISKRWWLIAKLMKLMPYWIYRRFG